MDPRAWATLSDGGVTRGTGKAPVRCGDTISRGTLRRYNFKDKVHSLDQFRRCRRSFGCYLGSDCHDRAHFTSKRVKEAAVQAADNASPSNLPLPEDISKMTKPSLLKACRALAVDVKHCKKVSDFKQAILARIDALKLQQP